MQELVAAVRFQGSLQSLAALDPVVLDPIVQVDSGFLESWSVLLKELVVLEEKGVPGELELAVEAACRIEVVVPG